jgi:hypothetical protein
MTKKKAKKKTGKVAAKKSPGKRSTRGKIKETHPAEVRKEVSRIVREHATKMAAAVVTEGEKGQLAPVKYLFEVAGVFPETTETAEGSPREDSLAETLLHRLNIPIEPVHRDGEEEEPVEIGAPVKVEEDEELETELKPGDDGKG